MLSTKPGTSLFKLQMPSGGCTSNSLGPPRLQSSGRKRVLRIIDVSYAAPQAYEIVNVALHGEYSPGIIFV
jgi:hypothetical protein